MQLFKVVERERCIVLSRADDRSSSSLLRDAQSQYLAVGTDQVLWRPVTILWWLLFKINFNSVLLSILKLACRSSSYHYLSELEPTRFNTRDHCRVSWHKKECHTFFHWDTTRCVWGTVWVFSSAKEALHWITVHNFSLRGHLEFSCKQTKDIMRGYQIFVSWPKLYKDKTITKQIFFSEHSGCFCTCTTTPNSILSFQAPIGLCLPSTRDLSTSLGPV